MKAQQIDMLLVGFGTDYALGSAYFYAAGTATAKNVYDDKDKSNAVANPATLDASGRTANPIYADGWYKVVVKKADTTGTLTFDNLYYGVLESTDKREGGVISKTSAYQILKTDDFILGDCTAGSMTFTLPLLTGFTENTRLYIIKTDATANTLTVDGSGAETINGGLTKVIETQYLGYSVFPDDHHTGWLCEDSSMSRWLETSGLIRDANDMIKDTLLRSVAPAGSIYAYGAAVAPTGFLLCNGGAVSRATYADLFAVISTTWGVGDGSTTFNVPDFRSKSPIGAGTGASLTNRVLATIGGEEAHALTTLEIPSHAHAEEFEGTNHVYYSGTAGAYNSMGGSSSNNSTAVSTGLTGGGEAHTCMHPWIACSFIIKT